METITKTQYKCGICGAVYDTVGGATRCEEKPLSADKGVKVGDEVLITNGDGTGKRAKVTSVSVLDKEWGHYAWERYWHTVVIHADIIDGFGSRMLTFDSYEV